MSEKSSEDLAAWVSAYAADADVGAFVRYVDQAILASIPELALDPVLTSELHASTRAQFRAFLNILERVEQHALLPPQALDLALSIARRNLELGVLLKIYRIAAASCWAFFTRVANAVPDDGPDRADVLVYLWDRAGSWINEATEQLIQVFYDERQASMQGVLARRAEVVDRILRGDAVQVDAASTELGHRLRAVQTGVILWVDQVAVDDSLAPLNVLAATLASSVGAGRPLILPVGRREVWCWLATGAEPDLARLRELVLAQDGPPVIRVAVGLPASGPAGFRQSHREAIDGQRLAASCGSEDVFTAYEDVELVCLMSGNDDGARALTARELRALRGPDPALQRVRDTVRLFLSYGGSVERTAAALVVHKNTIRYRLAQAEELIGHPLSERRTELDLALRYVERHGPTVLS